VSTPVNLTGRLTADPELRYTANGTPVAKFSVVTSRRVRDKTTGEYSDAHGTPFDVVARGMLEDLA
jgi:single-strand DNA-binding protein